MIPEDEAWAVFQAAYPSQRRAGGFMANQRFLEGCRKVGLQVILDAVEAQKTTAQWQKGMVPGIEKWLERELWLQGTGPPVDSPASCFLAWFITEYAATRHGAVYFISAEKHTPIVSRLLKHHAIERLKQHAHILLTTDEDWVETTDRGIEVLSTKINWLEDRLAQWEVKRAHG